MGAGNNIGINKAKTDFVLILNPDVILEQTTINELIVASQKVSDFAILAPISSDINYPNYKLDKNKKLIGAFSIDNSVNDNRSIKIIP